MNALILDGVTEPNMLLVASDLLALVVVPLSQVAGELWSNAASITIGDDLVPNSDTTKLLACASRLNYIHVHFILRPNYIVLLPQNF